MGSKICPYKLILCPQVEDKICIPPHLLVKIILVTRIWSKSVFRVVSFWWHNMCLKTLLLKTLVTKMIYSRKLGDVYFFPLPVGQIWAYMERFYCLNSDFKGKHACLRPNHTSKRQVLAIFVYQKLRLLKILTFWRGLRFLRCRAFAILKYVKIPKMVQNVQFFWKD